MGSYYRKVLFGPSVKAAQEANGSRKAYAREEAADAEPDYLTESEAAFITSRDSFYMASVGEGGWPYIQHRGGPVGFVKILGPRLFGFADFRGNRQYVSLGNLGHDNRASFFFMDYVRRARLKLLGRVTMVDVEQDAELRQKLVNPGYKAVVERAFVVEVEAFDWNCPQHIAPRYTMAEIMQLLDPLKDRIRELEAQVANSGT